MASPNFVMSGEICRAICEYKRDHSECTLTELQDWVSETHRQRLCISTISEILDLNLSSPISPSANFYFGDGSNLPSERGAENEDEECMLLSEDSEAETEEEDEEVEEDDDDDEEDEAEDEEMEDQDLALTLSDPDLLNCPVCTQPLTIPVYQCENGHVLCASCCSKIDNNKCPSCCSNIGQNRHQFVEKLLESLTAPCRNKKYGCEEMLKHYNKNEHEKTCPNSPCSCPVPSCNFKGSSLYAHFSRSHIFATPVFSYNSFNPITLERGQRCLIFCGEDNGIFVLSRFSEGKGSAINVVRIAPLHCETLAYAIKVKCDETSIVLQSSLKNIPEWEDCLPERNFLVVPDYFATLEGKLHLQLCVWSGGVPAGVPNQLVVFRQDSSL